MSIANTPYDTIRAIYDVDEEKVAGSTYVSRNPSDMYNITFEGGLNQHTGWKFRDCYKDVRNYVGHDDSNPIITTIGSYANGIVVKEKSAVTLVNGHYYFGHTTWMEDENGSYIDINGLMGRSITDTPDTPLAHSYEIDPTEVGNVILYYTDAHYTYYGSEDKNASYFSPLGTCFLAKPTNSPYSRPELIGNLSDQYVSTYYYRPSNAHSLENADDVDQFYDILKEKGNGKPFEAEDYEDDTSKPGGGDGDYNPFSDKVPKPGLPTGGDSISTGFVRVYTPSSGQLQQLSAKLWSDDFYDNILKIQNDPMEAIISLHSVPFNLSGSYTECVVGNYSTGIQMQALSSQFYQLNLGSINVPEHWGTALDYSPYVTVDCFVPYCGVVQLQVDDVVGKTLQCGMNVDVLSGATVAYIMCGESVLYTYNTNVIFRHPISSTNFGPLYQSIMGAVGSVASGLASGGGGGAIGGAVGGALNVALSKHSSISRGGSLGGSAGCLGHFTPYLIIHRPIQSLAAGFKHFKGYPSNITTTLGSLSGYTEVESVHLEGISCTDLERDEIMAQLYNGVIF